MAATSQRRFGLGWVPDRPDHRDLYYSAPLQHLRRLPASVDLRPQFAFAPYDQGRIGSCTANAIAAAFEFGLRKQELKDFMPSRLFIYYNERAMEGRVHFDSGAMIRDGIKSLNKLGVCPEDQWQYDDTPPANENEPWPADARAGKKPTPDCYKDALTNEATSYQRVIQEIDQLKGCLAAGFPFVFGFSVYTSFTSQQVASTGIAPMPAPDEQLLGGHAVLAVGYNNETGRFLVRNSWGTGWGQQGYFELPFAYLTTRGIASDFWTIRVVT
jgi:C1A family cysteine protease